MEKVARPECEICGSAGRTLYEELPDRIFSAPGLWRLAQCIDGACRHVWLDPGPRTENIPQLYDNYYTHAATQSGESGSLRRRLEDAYLTHRLGYDLAPDTAKARTLALLQMLMPGYRGQAEGRVFGLRSIPGGRVLDVGCGNGTALTMLESRGWNGEGVDFDETAVETARTAGLKVALGAIEDQDYPDDSFDAVVSSHVIEHVPDVELFLSECRRVLKPGGQLVFVTPNVRSMTARLTGRNYLGLSVPQHLQIFSSASLLALARRFDWASIDVRPSAANTHLSFSKSVELMSAPKVDINDPIPDRWRIAARLFQIAASLSRTGDELILRATK